MWNKSADNGVTEKNVYAVSIRAHARQVPSTLSCNFIKMSETLGWNRADCCPHPKHCVAWR